ncbi:glycosyltransferase family 2 protein [Hypoxylon crocopeplum]|nr:glycosyltransferase family 2 protein [Hypoxylon crocopeplum]
MPATVLLRFLSTLWSAKPHLLVKKLDELAPVPSHTSTREDDEKDILNVAPLHGKQHSSNRASGKKKGHNWSIRKIPDDEDPEFWTSSPSRRKATRLSNFTGAAPVFLFIWTFYLHAQCILNIGYNGWSFSREVVVMGIFVCIEILRIALGIMDCACRLIAAIYPVWRPRYQLMGDNVPHIDVIVTCCHESLDIIQDTVLGALAVDYPQDHFRVVLTDDGASAIVREWASELKKPNLYYTARVKKGAGGYKAGNLNHAVQFIKALPGGPADFIAGLDVDMIPEKKWLRAVLPHLILDPKMGLVTPKQDFYNVPTDDPLFQSNQTAWAISDFVRDSLDCAWNSGSGYVLRRAALEEIGGFSTGSVTEDVYSSMLMLSKGWKSAYLAESLQFGLVPSSYLGHIKQRTRWNIGGIQLGSNFNCYLSKAHTGQLSLKQRLCGFWCFTSAWCHILDMVDLLIIPALPSGYNKLPGELEILIRLARVSCITTLTHWLHDCGRGWVVGYRTALRESGLQKYMTHYYGFSIIRSFILPRSLGGTKPGFRATGSISSSSYERCASRRAPFFSRVRHIVLGCGVWVHLLLTASYLFYSAWHVRHLVPRIASIDTIDQGKTAELIPWLEVSWLAPRLFKVLGICLTPLRYTLSPPNDPPRDKLMGKREQKTGARHPTNTARRIKWESWSIFDFEVLSSVMMVLNVYVLVKIWDM